MTGRHPFPSLWSIAAVVVALLMLYLLGFGPACWLTHRWGTGEKCFRLVYWPIGLLAHDGPKSLQDAVWKTAWFGVGKKRSVTLPTSPFGIDCIRDGKGDIALRTSIIFAGPMPGSPEGPRISIAPSEIGAWDSYSESFTHSGGDQPRRSLGRSWHAD